MVYYDSGCKVVFGAFLVRGIVIKRILAVHVSMLMSCLVVYIGMLGLVHSRHDALLCLTLLS